jgi:hypothetical protein
MKVLRVAFVLMLLISVHVRAEATGGSIIGTWESDEEHVRMEYFQDGDHYNARLLWGNKIVEMDGTTQRKTPKTPTRAFDPETSSGSSA